MTEQDFIDELQRQALEAAIQVAEARERAAIIRAGFNPDHDAVPRGLRASRETVLMLAVRIACKRIAEHESPPVNFTPTKAGQTSGF